MLALSSVRGRWASFIGTFAAVALGAALLAMTLLVFASASAQVPPRLSKADVIVHGPLLESRDWQYAKPWTAAESAQLTQRLSEVAGVTYTAEDRTFYAQPRKDGPSQGHNWSSLRLGGYQVVQGNAPSSDREMAVDVSLGVDPGSELEVLFAQGPRTMTVSGTVTGPGIYVTDALAARLAPGVQAIGLVTDGTADLSTVDLTGGVAATGDARAVLEPREATSTRWLGAQLLSAMALLASFVTVFVVASTFALNAAQRRRELGLLRMIGATPRQVRRLVLGEALVVGTAASLAGAVAGIVAAPAFGRLLVRWGLENPDFHVVVQLWPIAVAALAGTMVGVLGAWSVSRRAAKAGPMEALREAAVEQRAMSLGRWVFGGLTLAGGAALAAATGSAEAENRVNLALLTAMALIVAAALLAPLVMQPLVRLVTAAVKRARGAAGMLVRAELLNATRRSASAAAPIIATVGFATLLTAMVSTMSLAYPAGESAELAGMSIVVPDGTPGLTEQAVLAAGGESPLPTRVFINGRSYEAVGTRAVSGAQADVTFADGTTHRMAAEFSETSDYEVLLPRDAVRAHDPSALSSMVFGGSVAAAGAKVVDAKEYADMEFSEDTRLLWLFAVVLVGLSVGYTGISVMNTMAMASTGRRVDLGVLRKAGATTRQVLAMHATETAIIVAMGALLGLAVTIPALAGMSSGLAEELSIPVPLRLHWPSMLAVCGAALLLAVLASTLSAWRTMRDGRRKR